ncbi:hypothetical protein [Lysobacter sp. Root690]|uniref:hypothetical protein n=1 Tax=Lysobacter sp. Root690 TaxID=1736588 RepID=UPI0006FB98E1|nr:hypothetical protein [Lysobacter sp. Root690]KRB11006.1 hypothetical protein ASD86_00695 [Lysobacter sp. Root690]
MHAGLDGLSLAQVESAVQRLYDLGRIELIHRGMMPEAEVFLCRYQGRRFNLKYDLAYGAELQAVAAFSHDELDAIAASLVAAADQ